MLRWLPKSLQNAIRRYFIAPAYARSTKPKPIAPDDEAPSSGQERHYRLHIAYDAFCEHRPPPRRLFRAHPARRGLTSWCDKPNAWTGRRKPRCPRCETAYRHYIAARDERDWKAECGLYRLARYGAVRLLAERRRYREERRYVLAARREEKLRRPEPMPIHFTPDLWAIIAHRGPSDDAHHLRERREVERALVRAHARHLRRETQKRRERQRQRELALEAKATGSPKLSALHPPEPAATPDPQPEAYAPTRISPHPADGGSRIRIGAGRWTIPIPRPATASRGLAFRVASYLDRTAHPGRRRDAAGEELNRRFSYTQNLHLIDGRDPAELVAHAASWSSAAEGAGDRRIAGSVMGPRLNSRASDT